MEIDNKDSPVNKQSIDKYIASALKLDGSDKQLKNSYSNKKKRVPIESPTKRLIKFQNKKVANKKEIARGFSAQRNVGPGLLYSSKPKAQFETSLGKFEEVSQQTLRTNQSLIVESQELIDNKLNIEKSLANELLPILKEKMKKM